MKIQDYDCDSTPYKTQKFGSNRAIIMSTLLGVQSTLSALSPVHIWSFLNLHKLHQCPTKHVSFVTIGQ
jgi:hypothetical protein